MQSPSQTVEGIGRKPQRDRELPEVPVVSSGMNLLLRWLFLTMAAVLGALFAGTFWLWARSGEPDKVEYISPNKWLLTVISGHGTVDILYIPKWNDDPSFRRTRYPHDVYYGTRYSKLFLGFGRGEQWPKYGGRYVNIPHWFLAALTGVGAGLSFRGWWRRNRRRRAGECRVCGYDLRATPKRCPECGTEAG